MELIKDNPDVSMVYTNARVFYAHGDGPAYIKDEELNYDKDLLKSLLVRCFIPMPSVIVRRGIFEKLNGFDEEVKFTEDYAFYLRFARIGKAKYIPECLAKYRVHPGNKSQDIIRRHAAAIEVL